MRWDETEDESSLNDDIRIEVSKSEYTNNLLSYMWFKHFDIQTWSADDAWRMLIMNDHVDWLQESEFPILVQFCPGSESEWDEIFFWWDETESDFIFMKWNRIEFFFVKWDKTEDESNFNEIKSNFFSIRWNKIRFIFYEIKQNWTSIWWNKIKQNWNKIEFSDSDLYKKW